MCLEKLFQKVKISIVWLKTETESSLSWKKYSEVQKEDLKIFRMINLFLNQEMMLMPYSLNILNTQIVTSQ